MCTGIDVHYARTRPSPKPNGGRKTTPAMAAGVENRLWTHRDIAALLD
ncbi:hypothetical protein HMPREF0591_4872 [Mycobacterium parascrofulaceum ATCC BAA-614]|uniref:Uncharacterized protein n=1 Tax=Mycobacterium parascrofulaceum ATCC BAA-614 TaxID=525368 RepID=D5PFC4_9MYCO|nr:hypothetical protein HMPREF0591_4872 [Mycobacterium parascrofulaceum ATCC BAA-614]